MDTIHLFENGYYHISNKAVAKCFLFKNEEDCNRIKMRIEKTLSPICDILAFGFSHDEFQMVVKLKSRKTFETYYLNKYEQDVGFEKKIPETTYLFANAMSNLQSGYAKWFNHKYKRDGGLMKGRYLRRLIESREDLAETISLVNIMKEIKQRDKIWTFRRKGSELGEGELKSNGARSSWNFYNLGEKIEGISCFKHYRKVYLRGHFNNLPPKRLIANDSTEKLENLLSFMFLKARK